MKLCKEILLLVTLTAIVCFVNGTEEKARNKRHLLKYLTRGFENVACRIRHRKTVLDRNGKYVRCTRYCGRDYIEQVSYRFGHYCTPKPVFRIGCENRWCTKCSKNWMRSNSRSIGGRCVRSCPVGTYPEMFLNRCRGCFYSYCKSCTSRNNCNQCASPRILLRDRKNNGKCVLECPTGLLSRYDQLKKTLVCVEQVTERPTPTSKPTPSVKPGCGFSYCVSCNGKENCTQCTSPRSLLIDYKNNGKCVQNCPSEFASRFNRQQGTLVCVKQTRPVKETVDEGCADRLCSTCLTDYLRLRSHGSQLKCVTKCPIGFAVSGSSCRACIEPRCSTCANDSLAVCHECKSGFALLARSPFVNECVRECPTTHTLKMGNGTVARCQLKPPRVCTIKYCSKCLHSDLDAFHAGCAQCEDKYYLKRDSFSDRCVAVCPVGFYGGKRVGSKVKSCLKCSVSFCELCTSAVNCVACLPPFVLNASTGQCNLCYFPNVFDPETRKCVKSDSFTNPPTTFPAPVFKIE